MARNLILTGWFHPDYLAAAAGVYGHYNGDADVQAVSKAELAWVLEHRGPNYRNVDILGVGLVENLDRLASVVKGLVGSGVAVNYFSAMAFPDDAKAAFDAAGARFTFVKAKDAEDIVQVVAGHFSGISALEAKRLHVIGTHTDIKIENYAKGKKRVGGKEEDVTEADVWQLLVEAAGFAHRDHGDDEAYADVVKGVHGRVSVIPKLPDRFRRLMEDYQAGFSREFLGKNPKTLETKARLQKAAQFDAHVLILGETGTGKQVAAEYIHSKSARRSKPFRHYNCAYGGSEDMVMTRLFGYAPGAFTGALKNGATGLFDDANGGTLFLDEIGETSERVQAMLLTVIGTGKFVRVGGREKDAVNVDVRLVCATNRDIQQMVLDGGFRLDLYQRIAEFPVELHPLRTRKDDIEVFTKYYWRNLTGRMATKKQIAALMNYDYPGNVRELISILKQAKSLNEDDFGKILAEHESFNHTLLNGLRERRDGVVSSSVYPDSQEELLCRHAVNIYGKYNQNLSKAAMASGVSVNTLKKYLRLAEGRGMIPAKRSK